MTETAPSHGLSEFDIEERKVAFQKVWRERFLNEVSLMPILHRDRIHGLLKLAFYAGSNWERRKQEPVQVGGDF